MGQRSAQIFFLLSVFIRVYLRSNLIYGSICELKMFLSFFLVVLSYIMGYGKSRRTGHPYRLNPAFIARITAYKI
jgi:hypothetical protein